MYFEILLMGQLVNPFTRQLVHLFTCLPVNLFTCQLVNSFTRPLFNHFYFSSEFLFQSYRIFLELKYSKNIFTKHTL
jgi:hypothetical protein